VEIAVMDFHSFPAKTEVNFTQRKHNIDIKGNVGPFQAGGGLGELHWKPTGMVPYGKASWELRDEGNLVVSVTIDDHQVNGVIGLWRSDLDPETVEELVIVGVSKIEEYRKLMRNSKTSAVSVASSAAWLA
jgi:predicted transcriptional regulator